MKIKHIVTLVCLGGLLLLGLGGGGCSRDSDTSLTGPVESPLPAGSSEGTPALLPNFYASRGYSDDIGVHSQPGEFVVQVPAGDHALLYETDSGGYATVFRAHENALVYIGLHDDQEVINALLIPGMITAIPSDARNSGEVTMCAWPGSSTNGFVIFESPILDGFIQYVTALVESGQS